MKFASSELSSRLLAALTGSGVSSICSLTAVVEDVGDGALSFALGSMSKAGADPGVSAILAAGMQVIQTSSTRTATLNFE
jgi:hypothetical protein